MQEVHYGLFWGQIFNEDGEPIECAADYFYELGKKNDCDFDYWNIISYKISDFTDEHFGQCCGKDSHYQSGFGGDECDGLIDFYVEKPIAIQLPDLEFEIQGKTYTISWTYNGEEQQDDD